MIPIDMPSDRLLHYLPELPSLLALNAALAAAECSLRAEHPTIDELPFDPQHDIVPSLLTAYLILARATELRELIHLYDASARRAVGFGPDFDLPF